jgi:hypothetical protein
LDEETSDHFLSHSSTEPTFVGHGNVGDPCVVHHLMEIARTEEELTNFDLTMLPRQLQKQRLQK